MGTSVSLKSLLCSELFQQSQRRNFFNCCCFPGWQHLGKIQHCQSPRELHPLKYILTSAFWPDLRTSTTNLLAFLIWSVLLRILTTTSMVLNMAAQENHLKCWRGCGSHGTLLHGYGNIKQCSHFGKTIRHFLIKLNICLLCVYDHTNALVSIYLRGTEVYVQVFVHECSQ